MREVYVNGQRFRSVKAFAESVGMSDTERRSNSNKIVECIETGELFYFNHQHYSLSGTAKHEAPEPAPVRSVPGQRSLLSCERSTFGLHQDKGDHLR